MGKTLYFQRGAVFLPWADVMKPVVMSLIQTYGREKSMTAIAVPSAGAVLSARNEHCELMAALAQVRRLYCDDCAKDQLLEALDRVVACARRYYREAGHRVERRDDPDADCRLAMLGSIVEYLELLRQYVDRFDKFGMLQDLNHLDCLLGSHDLVRLSPDFLGGRSRRLPPLSLRS